MGITFTKSYRASDGKCYATLEEAQIIEIERLLVDDQSNPGVVHHYTIKMIENKEAILNVLTTTDKSRPAARKLNGATRKPRAKKGPKDAAAQSQAA